MKTDFVCAEPKLRYAKSFRDVVANYGYFCWVTKEGYARLPGKDVDGGFEVLPDEPRNLAEEVWATTPQAATRVVSINKVNGVAVTFDWAFYKKGQSQIPVPESERASHVQRCAIAFAEWLGQNAPDGVTVYYNRTPIEDEIIVFVPAPLCIGLLGKHLSLAEPLIEKAWDKAHTLLQSEEPPLMGVKSLNNIDLWDKNQYFCWVNACGDGRLPDDSLCHDIEDLPADVQEISRQFWTEGAIAALVHVVSIYGKLGVTLDFGWFFSEDLLERLPANVDDVDAHLARCGRKFAEWLSLHAPDGVSVYYGDGTDPDGDEVVVFVPKGLCADVLGYDCKKAAPLVDRAWEKAEEFLGVKKKSAHKEGPR